MSQAVGPFCRCLPHCLLFFYLDCSEHPNLRSRTHPSMSAQWWQYILRKWGRGGRYQTTRLCEVAVEPLRPSLLVSRPSLQEFSRPICLLSFPFLPKTLEWYWLIPRSDQFPEPWENTVVLECRHLHSLARTSYDMTWDGRGGRVTADETTSNICLMLCEILPVC